MPTTMDGQEVAAGKVEEIIDDLNATSLQDSSSKNLDTEAALNHAQAKPSATSADGEKDGDSDADDNEPGGENPGLNDDAPVTVATKKKKKKNKTKGQRKTKAGTGFEEYFVDGPITPAEFEVEKGLYDPSFSFAQRVETAVQRFVSKRRLDQNRKLIFDRYLTGGGIDAGPKMFSGGLDAKNLENCDKDEIATLAATHFVPLDPSNPESKNYVVDFVGCLKSFLSYHVPLHIELGIDSDDHSPEEVKSVVGVIRNFLNYLVYHNVCPEHLDQLHAARALCDQAEKELWMTECAKTDLPGDFNRACSYMFGGTYEPQSEVVEEPEWQLESGITFTNRLTDASTLRTFKIGLVAHASPDVFSKYESQAQSKTIHVTGVEDVSLEITEVIPPNDEIRRLYQGKHSQGAKPLGILKARTWKNPHQAQEDLTEEEDAAKVPVAPEDYELWLEESILQHLAPGMKLDIIVRELSIGIKYFDGVRALNCSFFTISANEMMRGWRAVEETWLPMRKRGGVPLGDDESLGDEVPGDDVAAHEKEVAAQEGQVVEL